MVTIYIQAEEAECSDTPFSTFYQIPEASRVELRNSTPRFASTPAQKNENMKYFISSSRHRTHNLLRLHSHVLDVNLNISINTVFIHSPNMSTKSVSAADGGSNLLSSSLFFSSSVSPLLLSLSCLSFVLLCSLLLVSFVLAIGNRLIIIIILIYISAPILCRV